MKKTIFLLAVMVLTIFATNTWQEQPCWSLNQAGGWDPQYGLVDAKCRKFLDIVPGLAGSCNKDTWQIPFKDTASVAQWLTWSINGNRLLDLVRKPGTYAGIGSFINLFSNSDIVLSFSGFEDLKRIGSEDYISKYYSITDTSKIHPLDVPQWYSAAEFNSYTLTISFFGTGRTRKIWEKIVVENNDPACEYEDPLGATIIFSLSVVKPWIDPLTGYYRTILP